MTKSIRKFLLVFLMLIFGGCFAIFLASCDGCDSCNDDPEEDPVDMILSSIEDGNYTITVKDISVTIPDTEYYYVYADTTGNVQFDPGYVSAPVVYNNTVTFSSGEMYIAVNEDEDGATTYTAYANGSVSIYDNYYEVTNVYAAELYCDGEKVYIVQSLTTDGAVEEKCVITVDSNYIFGEVSYSDLTYYSYLSQLMTQLSSALTESETTDDSAMSKLAAILQANTELAKENANEMIETLFTIEDAEDGGYTLTFDFTAITEYLNDLHSRTLQSFTDKYISEGFYSNLQTTISGLGSKTVYEAFLQIFDYTAEYGIDKETTYEIINEIVTEISGETFDVEEEITTKGTALYILANLTFEEFLEDYAGIELDEVSEYLAEAAVCTPLGLMWGDDADDYFEFIMEYYNEFKDSFSMVINLGKGGSLSADIKLTDFEIVTNEATGATLKASGEITITSGAEIPTYAADTITNGSDVYEDLASAVSALDSTCSYLTVSNGVVTYTDGSYSVAISASSGAGVLEVALEGDNYTIIIMDATHDIEMHLYAYEDEDGNTCYWLGSSNAYTYDTNGNLTSLVELSGEYVYTTTYTYDSNGNLLTKRYNRSDYIGVVEYSYAYIYTYDLMGNELTESYKNSNGSEWSYTYTYDSSSNMTSKIYVSSSYSYSYIWTYDTKGNKLTENYTNSNGSEWSYTWTYDSNGNMTSEIQVNGDYTYTSTYTYDSKGNQTYFSYESKYNGEVEYSWSYTYTYDSNSNKTYEGYEDSIGNERSTTYTYDSDGNVTSKVEVDGDYIDTYTYTYDADGNELTENYEEKYCGTVVYSYSNTCTYHSNGNTASTVRVEKDYRYTEDETYDSETGTWVTTVTITNVYTYTYNETYNSDGYRTYESYERKLNDTVLNSNAYTYTYDANGNRTYWGYTSTNSSGDTITWAYTYVYDSIGRMTSKVLTYSDSDTSYTETYTYTYSGYSLTQYTAEYKCGDITAKYVITINSKGNKTAETYTDSLGNSHNCTYDSEGRALTLTYKDVYTEATYNTTYRFTYDSDGNTLTENYSQTVTYANGDTESYSYSYTYTYDSDGNTLTENYTESTTDVDGDTETYSYYYKYDSDGNVLAYSTTTTDADGNCTESYTCDSNGNKLTENYSETDSNNQTNSYSYTYTYNDYGWKATEVYSNSNGSSHSYTYTYEITSYTNYSWATLYNVNVTVTDADGNTVSSYTTSIFNYN